jgi:hypothetical protein
MSQITEWEFTADVASQINEILKERVDLPFSEAKCEQRKSGQVKRRDLTLLNKAKKPVFTGEVKMPDKRDGRSPLNETAVIDAHYKANEIGVEYFFTWNVNDCVLWKTFEQGKSITERSIEPIKALPAPIAKSDELLNPRICIADIEGKRRVIIRKRGDCYADGRSRNLSKYNFAFAEQREITDCDADSRRRNGKNGERERQSG